MASTLPKRKCAFCGSRENISRCAGCDVVHYCCHDHQVEDQHRHEEVCNRINKTRKKLARQERELHEHHGNTFRVDNDLEIGVDDSWAYIETSPDIEARYALIKALLQVKTVEAVQAALDQCMDVLRAGHPDSSGVRDLIPQCLVRLGRDQECYDFIKWYATMDEEGNYYLGDRALPCLDVRNADVFEPVDVHTRRFLDLSHNVAVTLIKIKLLTDLDALQKSTLISNKVPKELLDNIRSQLVSKVIVDNKDVMKCDDQRPRIEQVRSQIDLLYSAVDRANRHFWPTLLDPGSNLTTRPSYRSSWEQSNMQTVLQHSYDAWIETPGAINLIRTKVEQPSKTGM